MAHIVIVMAHIVMAHIVMAILDLPRVLKPPEERFRVLRCVFDPELTQPFEDCQARNRHNPDEQYPYLGGVIKQ